MKHLGRKLKLTASIVLGLYLLGLVILRFIPHGPPAFASTVEVVAVQKTSLSHLYFAPGTVTSVETLPLKTEIPGTVSAILVPEGSKVAAGTLLMTLENAEQTAAVHQAQAQLNFSIATYERSKKLSDRGFDAEQTKEEYFNALQAAFAQKIIADERLKKTEIRAPVDGTFGIAQVHPGDFVNAGTLMANFKGDKAPLLVTFSLSAEQHDAVTLGMPITATLTQNTQPYLGEILSIDPTVDPYTRQFQLQANLFNAPTLVPGQFVNVIVKAKPYEGLVVPESAIVHEATEEFVFLVKDHLPTKQKVTIGQRGVGWVQIAEGVAAGDPIVIRGQQKIIPGVPTAVKILEWQHG